MIIFIILRILDIITTLLNIKLYGGWEVELNPTMKWIGSRGLFIPYQIIVVILAVLIIERLRFKKVIYISLSIISLFAVLINLFCLVNY
jgi:uncharacterized membrane protein